MKSSITAKVFGWAQFGLQLLTSIGQGSAPHGWAQWLTFGSSLAAAIGIHASSNTDGTK